MSDVATCGPQGGELHVSCQGWYIESPRTEQNRHFDCHFIENSNANSIT